MSLQRNTFANYLGNAYVLSIAIVVYPLFLGYVGAEPYGLISVFIMMQAIFMLLDMGLAPIFNRQAADCKALPAHKPEFQRLVRSVEVLLMLPSLTLLLAFYLVPGEFLTRWLHVELLSADTVATCLRLMLVISLLRVLASLYRSAVLGFERQVWFNGFNVLMVSLKYPGALFLFHWFELSIVGFFVFQLLVALLEFVFLRQGFYRFAQFESRLGLVFDLASIRKVIPLSAGVAYTAMLWVLVTQFDKVLLSGLLPLAEFGYFGLVILVASSMLQVSGPLNQAILPRMTAYYVQGQRDKLLHLYLLSSQIMTAIVASVGLIMAMYPQELLLAWTNDEAMSVWSSGVLRWYALGYALLTLGALQYVLQFAHGNLRLHVIGATAAVIIQLPLIFFAATHYGALGAALAWFGFRTLFFLVWSPVVHYSIQPGLHLRWLAGVGSILAGIGLMAFVLWMLALDFSQSARLMVFVWLMAIGALTLLVGLGCSQGKDKKG